MISFTPGTTWPASTQTAKNWLSVVAATTPEFWLPASVELSVNGDRQRAGVVVIVLPSQIASRPLQLQRRRSDDRPTMDSRLLRARPRVHARDCSICRYETDKKGCRIVLSAAPADSIIAAQ